MGCVAGHGIAYWILPSLIFGIWSLIIKSCQRCTDLKFLIMRILTIIKSFKHSAWAEATLFIFQRPGASFKCLMK